MKDCPEKWPDKRFKENDNFFPCGTQKVVGSALKLSTKGGSFSELFLSPDPKSEKKTHKSTNKKILALYIIQTLFEANVPQGLLHL